MKRGKITLLQFGSFIISYLLLGAALTGCLLLPYPRQTPYPDIMPTQAAPLQEEERLPTAEELVNLSEEEKAVYEVYRRNNRAVVKITSYSVRYNWFLQPVPQEGTGSGSIFDARGYVLTNYTM